MVTLKWKVENLKRNTSDGGVLDVHWAVSATEFIGAEGEEPSPSNILTGHMMGWAMFTPDPKAEGFLPYESLTEEIVLQWVFDQMGEETKAVHEANVLNQIEARKNPPTINGMPW